MAELIPPREHWRLYAEFQREAAFFDIETEGGSLFQPTVASVFDREGLHVFICGRNLDQFPEVLAASRLWVTFNGSCFDIPALKAHFDSFPTPPVHVDLRFACRRVGLSGGLKQKKVYNRAVDLLGCEVPRVSVFDRGDVLYDLSKLLLALGRPEHEPRLRARLRSERRALV